MADRVHCEWSTEDSEVADAITAHADMIARDTNLSAFVRQSDHTTMTIEKTVELAPGKSLWLAIRAQ